MNLLSFLKSYSMRIKLRLLRYISLALLYLYSIILISKKKDILKPQENLILVCRFDFYGKNKDFQSSDYFYIDNYFEETGLNFTTFFWDNPERNFADIPFISEVLKQKPSQIVMMGYNPRSIYCPHLLTLKLAKKFLETKIFSIWGDTGNKQFIKENIDIFYSGVFDKHICIDNPTLDLELGLVDHDEKKKFIPKMFTPESEKIYFPSECKDIEVAFLGQISSYRDYRGDYIDYASDKLQEYKTYFSTKDRVNQINHSDYANIINRSKIGLNFSRSVNIDQLKGRVLHTMLSGALLLETKNTQTDLLFEDGKEYVSFTSKEEMIDKIKFYLRNDKIREEIAKNGREKVLHNYSRKAFWDKVLTDSNSINLENA